MFIYDKHSQIGQARRSSTPSYSKASMDSYMLAKNDSWSAISNTSELQAYINQFIFLEFTCTDTGNLARVILYLRSISGTTIYTDNIGWGYSGSVWWDWSLGKIPSEGLRTITYNGTTLNVIKKDTTNVYGRPFTLSLSQGAGTTLTVSRSSSPNEHANTGTLKSGATIYYGDVLTVSVTASSGYINPTYSGFTSGGSVTDNVTITSSATPYTPSWHTVWTGSKALSASLSMDDTTQTTALVAVANSQIGISDKSLPTRITGTSSTTFGRGSASFSFNAVEYSSTATTLGNKTSTSGTIFNIENRCVFVLSTTQISAIVTTGVTTSASGTNTITLTKVEQYY